MCQKIPCELLVIVTIIKASSSFRRSSIAIEMEGFYIPRYFGLDMCLILRSLVLMLAAPLLRINIYFQFIEDNYKIPRLKSSVQGSFCTHHKQKVRHIKVEINLVHHKKNEK